MPPKAGQKACGGHGCHGCFFLSLHDFQRYRITISKYYPQQIRALRNTRNIEHTIIATYIFCHASLHIDELQTVYRYTRRYIQHITRRYRICLYFGIFHCRYKPYTRILLHCKLYECRHIAAIYCCRHNGNQTILGIIFGSDYAISIDTCILFAIDYLPYHSRIRSCHGKYLGIQICHRIFGR